LKRAGFGGNNGLFDRGSFARMTMIEWGRVSHRIDEIFDEHLRVVERARAELTAVLLRVSQLAAACIASGGKLLVCGNGGSAADAQHFAAECVCRFEKERAAFPAIALSTDTSAMTAIANDYGYEHVFARQVSGLARPGDVLFALSTSGRSPNVIRAAEAARMTACQVVAFTGQGGGKLAALADIVVAVPSTTVARIQEVHGVCLHAIAGALEDALAGR
jgi:D-sedoheptulose 7-phosphate isomerase